MLKNRFIKKRQGTKTAEKTPAEKPSTSSDILLDPPEQFCNTQTEEVEEHEDVNGSGVTTKSLNSELKDNGNKLQTNSSSDDYGFLPFPSNIGSRKSRTLRPQSPKPEVDTFDNSLFDIGFLRSTEDCVPKGIGSLSSVTSLPNTQADTQTENVCSSDMLAKAVQLSYHSSQHQKRSHYIATEANTNLYEKTEGHYARLVDLSSASRPTNQDSKTELNFYVQKAAEQRARSKGPEGQRGRSRSTTRREARSRSRGQSASRDIISLYTNRPVSGNRLRQTSVSPVRKSMNQFSRRQSPSPDRTTRHNKMEIHVNSNRQASSTEAQKSAKFSEQIQTDGESSIMTLLEMDIEKTAEIDRELEAANSLKPASVKMMMIANHSPSSSWSTKDEIAVKVGDNVKGIYKQNEWLYIMTQSGQMGFVPYALTKPVKVTDIQKYKSNLKLPLPAAKPVTGILKTSNYNKHKQRRTHPKFSVKVRTAADTDSLSSESGSATAEDFVYTRHKNSTTPRHADCMVIDTDDIPLAYDRTHIGEEMSTNCSDSGISDPSSNHSEDMDSLNSPLGLTDERNVGGYCLHNLTPRLPNERIVSVTTELLSNSPYNSIKNSRTSATKNGYCISSPISDMPLGPLGVRLAELSMDSQGKGPKTSCLNTDMKERAKSSGTTPSALRPEIPKDYNGPRVTVVFDYEGGNQDDLIVHASDIVTVLNSEDIEWIWVQRRDGKEGFIPREFVIPLDLSMQNRRRVGISLL